jgi:PhzF family phenazine biosynthesis protein
LASFSLLRDQATLALGHHTFNSKIGKQEVEVMDRRVGLWQKQLFHKEVCDNALLKQVANSIGVKTTDLVTPIRHASNGSPFLLIELRDIEILKALEPNQEDILRLSEALDLVGYYVFTRAKDQSVDVRMFAPRYGIREESATGMGAGALSLSLSKDSGAKHLIIRQGHLMPTPSPSLLITEIHGENIVLVHGETTLLKKVVIAQDY